MSEKDDAIFAFIILVMFTLIVGIALGGGIRSLMGDYDDADIYCDKEWKNYAINYIEDNDCEYLRYSYALGGGLRCKINGTKVVE